MRQERVLAHLTATRGMAAIWENEEMYEVIEAAEMAVKKTIPMEPQFTEGLGNMCPVCSLVLLPEYNFCPICGQHIDRTKMRFIEW